MRFLTELEEILNKATDADVVEVDGPKLEESVQSNVGLTIEIGRLVARVMQPRAKVEKVILRIEGGRGELVFTRAKQWAIDLDLQKLGAALSKPANKPGN